MSIYLVQYHFPPPTTNSNREQNSWLFGHVLQRDSRRSWWRSVTPTTTCLNRPYCFTFLLWRIMWTLKDVVRVCDSGALSWRRILLSAEIVLWAWHVKCQTPVQEKKTWVSHDILLFSLQFILLSDLEWCVFSGHLSSLY